MQKLIQMTEVEFIPSPYTHDLDSGKVTWQSPSNIALVKYWGKKENQIPANPSISFTLSNCTTTTTVSYKKLEVPSSGFSFDFVFEGESKEDFKPKIVTFFKRIEKYLPFLKKYHFVIESSNSFPHSSGIASSASSMSALALCCMDLESQLVSDMNNDYFLKKASFLSRLGSGSACRSLKGPLVEWGAHKDFQDSSDLYGVPFSKEVHSVFQNYQDTVLLVDKGEKQVSSTVGHGLMHGHPFADKRFEQAHENLGKLKSVLVEGDLDGFIGIVESEALTLHAMMMTSMPYFILMKPNTLEIINKIWEFRKKSHSPICFTLDAGANVHVLYPASEKKAIHDFIDEELSIYCQNGQYIHDCVGFGARKLV